MKAPDGFELENKTFLEDGSPEYLEWVPFDTEKTIYPEFFKTELKNPSRETKYIVADEIIDDPEDIDYFSGDEYRSIIKSHLQLV